MPDRLFMSFLKLLPRSALSRAVGAMTRLPVTAAIHHAAAKTFAWRFQVALGEAELPLESYPTFGDFFTRRLKPGARPVAPGEAVVVSPVDALVAAVGRADQGRLIQAKGRDYTLAALLDDPEAAARYEGGEYLTLYLSPRDYHRIHVPLSGMVSGYRYVPGTLFPVNAPAVRCVPNLFCVNERLITWLQTAAGEIAVVKVGATCVGRIRVSYDSVTTNVGGAPARRRYEPPIAVEKGDELGLFEMGSTVILLFEPGRIDFDAGIVEGRRVRMGEPLATVRAPGR